MLRRAIPTIALLALSAAPATAQPGAPAAEPAPGPDVEEQVARAVVEEVVRTEVRPTRGLIWSLAAGFHTDVAAAGELRLGWGTGRVNERLLLPTTTLWRVSLAARGAYGREDSVALSLLGGWSKVSSLGISLEAGVDARVDAGDRAAGPIASIGVRAGQLGLHVTAWAHFAGATDGGGLFALGYTAGDYTGSGEIAKARARRQLDAALP